jgi:formylglycine-generating enzyme required for sulfatase activity
MKRFFQQPAVGCLISLGLALALFLAAGDTVQSRQEKLPKIEPKAHKDYFETLTDKVKFEMIAIPGGTYLMGSPESEPGRSADEGPQHPVTVRPFWMAPPACTWAAYDLYWRRVPGAAPPTTPTDKAADAVTRPTPPYADETFGHGRDGHPVLCITYHAAMQYCAWLSAKTGKTYRLPTEAEWEWACRAGTTTAYSFGNDPATLGEYAWYEKNSDDTAHKVGEKKANPWGLYDMHGGLAEWCIDLYQKDYYSKFPTNMPTLTPVLIPGAVRFPNVVRGGSWIDPPEKCRSAARRHSDKDCLRRDPQRPQSIWWLTEAEFVGFRVVRPVEEQENLKALKSKVTRESP